MSNLVVKQASTELRPPPALKTESGTRDWNQSSNCSIRAEAQNAITHWKNTQRPLAQRCSISTRLRYHGNIGIQQTFRPDTISLYLRKNTCKTIIPRNSQGLQFPPAPTIQTTSSGTLTPYNLSQHLSSKPK